LEIFTERRPTDELFKDDLNLHNFVKLALQRQVLTQILDRSVLNEEGETENMVRCWSDWTNEEIECLILVFHIGLACSAQSPRDRMDMTRVSWNCFQLETNSLETKLMNRKWKAQLRGTVSEIHQLCE
jgi:LRR receptor-like serine/threonine-protein kinase EFR